MAIKFTPKTEAETATPQPFPAGVYDFEIVKSETHLSKAGKDMLKLQVKIYNDKGQTRTVFSYIDFDGAMSFLGRHLCEATGLLDEYEKGEIEPFFFEGKTGQCKVRVKAASGDYEARNEIADFISNEDAPKTLKEAIKDDGIPF